MFLIKKNWYELLKEEFNKPYYKNLSEYLAKEYQQKTIYPKAENVFASLNYVPYEKVKVVIIGQDPYHEPNQAHGLSFSVEHSELPPSLKNIFKEIKNEYNIENTNGNLVAWAKQGVLLLNSVLTVQKGVANSHKDKGWEVLTTEIIKLLNKRTEPLVFIFWGSMAQKLKEYVDEKKHLVLCCPHPSPLSAYSGFFGCGHFLKANEFLLSKNQKEIDWHT